MQQQVYLPGNTWFISGSARYLSNNSLALYLQQLYALTVGTSQEFGLVSAEFNIGPSYGGQHFTSTDTSTGYPAIALREQASIALPVIVDGAELSQSISYGAPTRGGDPRTADLIIALVLPINRRLSVTFAGNGDYVSNTPVGFKNSYFSTSVGLSAKLGHLQ